MKKEIKTILKALINAKKIEKKKKARKEKMSFHFQPESGFY